MDETTDTPATDQPPAAPAETPGDATAERLSIADLIQAAPQVIQAASNALEKIQDATDPGKPRKRKRRPAASAKPKPRKTAKKRPAKPKTAKRPRKPASEKPSSSAGDGWQAGEVTPRPKKKKPAAAKPKPKPTAAKPKPAAAKPKPATAKPKPKPATAKPKPKPTAAKPKPTAGKPRPATAKRPPRRTTRANASEQPTPGGA